MIKRTLSILTLLLMFISCKESDISINSLNNSTWVGTQVDLSGTEYNANVYFTGNSDITIVLSNKSETFTYGPYQTNISSNSIEIFTPNAREEDPVWYIQKLTRKDLHLVYFPNSPFEKKLILKRTF